MRIGLFPFLVLVGTSFLAVHVNANGEPSESADVIAGDAVDLTPAQRAALNRIRSKVVEAGVIESESVLGIHNPVPGEGIVASSVANGSFVNKGDVLLTLSHSGLRDARLEQQIAVQEAAAAVQASQAELDAVVERAAFEIPVAEFQDRVAELARRRYLSEGGELECQLARISREIAHAEERLEAVGDSASIIAQNPQQERDEPIPQSDNEAQAHLDAKLAEKQLLEQFIRPHRAAVLELAVLKARANLKRTHRAVAAAKESAESQLQIHERVLTAEQSRLERIEQDIESCRILAPRDGVVLHAAPSGRRAGGSPLEAGATVRERQLLMEMPDLQRLRARILVHESQVARVRVGQEVSLRLDSFPSRNFGGEVVEISRTPEPRSWLNPEVVEYAVLVGITAPPEAKIGMTVVAAIDAQGVESD